MGEVTIKTGEDTRICLLVDENCPDTSLKFEQLSDNTVKIEKLPSFQEGELEEFDEEHESLPVIVALYGDRLKSVSFDMEDDSLTFTTMKRAADDKNYSSRNIFLETMNNPEGNHYVQTVYFVEDFSDKISEDLDHLDRAMEIGEDLVNNLSKKQKKELSLVK